MNLNVTVDAALHYDAIRAALQTMHTGQRVTLLYGTTYAALYRTSDGPYPCYEVDVPGGTLSHNRRIDDAVHTVISHLNAWHTATSLEVN